MNNSINEKIEKYTADETGWTLGYPERLTCKLKHDLEDWCFINRTLDIIHKDKLFEFASHTIGSQIRGNSYYKSDHIEFAHRMFQFYRNYAETIV